MLKCFFINFVLSNESRYFNAVKFLINNIKNSFIVAILLLMPFGLGGVGMVSFEHIDISNGLSHNTVRYITQDSRGLIWIGTLNGLDRYDGHRFVSIYPGFTNLSLSENNIRLMFEDRHGYLWVQTTSRFMNCYDLRKESFVDYTGTGEARQYRSTKVLSNGDLWLWGTEQGACRVRYLPEGGFSSLLYDKSNIGTDVITFVFEDSSGKIWVGSDKGLLQMKGDRPESVDDQIEKYDYHSAFKLNEKLYFFTYDCCVIVYDINRKAFLDPIPLPADRGQFSINQTALLDGDNVLITGKQGVLLFNLLDLRFVDATRLFGESHLENVNMRIDNKGKAWLFNKTGNIWKWEKRSHAFRKYTLIPPAVLSAIDHERYAVFVDSRGITWISTYGNGLFAIEPDGTFSHYTTESSNLRTNYLLFVTEDRAGNVWVGTENAGIAKIFFNGYRDKLFIPPGLKTESPEKMIRSAYQDSQGNVWIGTKNGDIYICDSDWNIKDEFSGKSKGIYTIHPDAHGNIWVGTKGDGLRIFPKGGMLNNAGLPYLLSPDKNAGENNIYAILCDTKGRMWVGTFGNGLFLCEWDGDKLIAKGFSDLTKLQRQIRCLIQDKSGKIWAGGENGVVVFDPEHLLDDQKAFDWYHFERNDPSSLNNNIVKTILEDSQGRIWLGTAGGGLNLAVNDLSQDRMKFLHYSIDKGLTNNVVQAIVEDNLNFLWITTEGGLSRFNPAEDLFENFNFTENWNSDYFSEAVGLKMSNGNLLFGNYNGVYVIDPVSFSKSVSPSPVRLTGLQVNGLPVSPGSADSPLNESIIGTRKIRLKHNQNSFGIEFSSLNFQSGSSNRYTYILEHYDHEWNPVTPYNVATYKNIPPGKYLFRVKSVNDPYNMDDTEATLEIVVTPPFWRSTWAWIIYFVSGALIAFFSVKMVGKMNRLNNQIEIEKQLTEYRLRFFTNISHEFRTPLTIIRGSIESMKEATRPEQLKKHVDTLEKSSNKLMRLIDQLLEFRKLQNNQMELEPELVEVESFLKGIYDLFSEIAERQKIEFSFVSNAASKIILLDKGKVEKVVFNLLSNAFKHTPENGNIKMELSLNPQLEQCVIRVSDSGIGIPPEKRHLLFRRFQQINHTASGIGIGLHLTAELVKAHRGEIVYSASEWGGACFTVILPMIERESVTNEKAQTSLTDSPQKKLDSLSSLPNDEESEYLKPVEGKNYRILLIEDDEEIRLFLYDRLKEHFVVDTAPNGLQGWEMAVNNQPHLIVCDVMMPEMDGFEVTRKIRADFQTSHIPIILLTAHSSIEHQLEGINAGADAYIIKPFSTKYLISRIVKLIEQRERLQYKFAHEPEIVRPTITTTDKDAQFIEKIHDVIEKHLDDSRFTVDDFARECNLGRTIFFQKVKGITNYSPNEYLRIVRLKKAAELLNVSKMNVSEIAYEVGFNDPDYFSKCFKEQFGVTPRQYRTKLNV